VTVTFAQGVSRDFDVVIAADGIRSRTRTFIGGDEPRIRELGLYASYFTIPRSPSDSPSPVSGMGASLALVGAYVLAGELARHVQPQDAFVAYETRLRPYVTLAQKLPPGVPWLAHPQSRLGIALLHQVLWLAAGPLFRLRKQLAGTSSAAQIDLPDYALGDSHP